MNETLKQELIELANKLNEIAKIRNLTPEEAEDLSGALETIKYFDKIEIASKITKSPKEIREYISNLYSLKDRTFKILSKMRLINDVLRIKEKDQNLKIEAFPANNNQSESNVDFDI